MWPCRKSGADLARSGLIFILLRFLYFCWLEVAWARWAEVVPAMRRLLLLVVAGSAGSACSTVSRGSSLALCTLPVSLRLRTKLKLTGGEEGRKEKEGKLELVGDTQTWRPAAILQSIWRTTSVTGTVLPSRWSLASLINTWSGRNITVKLWLSWQKTRLVTRDIVT